MRGPFSTPITPLTGSLFHADPQHLQVMRVIERMKAGLGDTWSGSRAWADVAEQTAILIVELGSKLNSAQLAMLMSIGAMAHRQQKIERTSEEATHV